MGDTPHEHEQAHPHPHPHNHMDGGGVLGGGVEAEVASLLAQLPHSLRPLNELSMRIPESREYMLQQGAVRRLAEYLLGASLPEQDCALALSVLWNMSSMGTHAKVEMERAGLLPRMVEFASSHHAPVVWTALGCLSNLALVARNRVIVYETPGCVPQLLALLRSSEVGIVVTASDTLKNLALDATISEAITRSGAIERFMINLAEGNEDVRACSASALWNLSATSLGVEALMRHLDALLAFLPRSEGADGVQATYALPQTVLRVLANLSRHANDDQLQVLREKRLPELASQWLTDEVVAFEVACIVANLLGTQEDHPLLVTQPKLLADLAEEFTRALNGESTRHNQHAYAEPWELGQGFANLSVSEPNKEKLLETGVVPLLLRLIREHGDDDRSIIYGARCAANLSFITDLEDYAEGITATLRTLAERPGRHEAKTYAQLALFQMRERQVKRETSGGSAGASADAGAGAVAAAGMRGGGAAGAENTGKGLVLLCFPPQFRQQESYLEEMLPATHCEVVRVQWANNMETLAQTVGRCDAVVVALCPQLKQSEACRSVVELAARLGKTLVPIRTVENYVPDGWLSNQFPGQVEFHDFDTRGSLSEASLRWVSDAAHASFAGPPSPEASSVEDQPQQQTSQPQRQSSGDSTGAASLSEIEPAQPVRETEFAAHAGEPLSATSEVPATSAELTALLRRLEGKIDKQSAELAEQKKAFSRLERKSQQLQEQSQRLQRLLETSRGRRRCIIC